MLHTMPGEIDADVNTTDFVSLLHKTLTSAEKPMSLSAILKQLPRAVRPNRLLAEELLHEEVKQQRVFLFPKIRDQDQYWSTSPTELARREILDRLRYRLRSESEVVHAVHALASLKQLSKEAIRKEFKALEHEGLIKSCKPFSRRSSKLYSATPVDPGDYVLDAMDKLSKKLEIPRDELLQHYHRRTSGTGLQDVEGGWER